MLFTDPLYKIDSNKNVRVWYIEYDSEKYRTYSGVNEGKIVISGWIFPKQKNVGKKNETSISEQVLAEVNAKIIKQKSQGQYHTSIEESRNGSIFAEPMLAKKYDKDKHIGPFYSQPKLDGMRCIITKDKMFSREGKEIISAPHILKALSLFFKKFPNITLDGELYNHDLRNNFEKLISLTRKTKPTEADLEESSRMVQFYCYDVMLDKPYPERYMFLMESLNEQFDFVKVVESVEVSSKDEIDKMLALYLELQYEGQMLRDLKTFYENKRSASLLKNKEFEDAEFEIVSVIEGVGNWAGKAKSVEIKLENGETQESGIKGNFEFTKYILENTNEFIGTFATVRYQNRTADGKLRFPVVQVFWKGKRDV